MWRSGPRPAARGSPGPCWAPSWSTRATGRSKGWCWRSGRATTMRCRSTSRSASGWSAAGAATTTTPGRTPWSWRSPSERSPRLRGTRPRGDASFSRCGAGCWAPPRSPRVCWSPGSLPEGLMALTADRLHARSSDELRLGVAVRGVRGVTPHAVCPDTVMGPNRVVRVARAPLQRLLLLGRERRLALEDRGVALGALLRAELERHAVGLTVASPEELARIDSREGPHAQAHHHIGAAVAVDAAHSLTEVRAGEVGEGDRAEALELLLVQVARKAEAVVALLGDHASECDARDQPEPRQ